MHFHASIKPQNDFSQYIDLFARSLSLDLNHREITLDAAGGGRGENSGIDSFYVHVDFK